MRDGGWPMPPDWELKEVRDLAETYAGGTPSRSARGMFGGAIPWVKSSELNQGVITQTEETLTEKGFHSASVNWIPDNTPLVAMYGATAGVVAWLEIQATANQAVLAVNCFEGTISRWLHWALSFHTRRMLKRLQGSGQPNLSKTLIEQLEIPTPPTDEQRRIAEILDRADEAIRCSERVIAKLREMKKGLLHDLLTRGLDAEGSLRDPEMHPEQFKDSRLGRIPLGWNLRDLGDVVKLIRNGTSSRQVQEVTPYSVTRIETISEGEVDHSSVGYLSEPEPKYLMKAGDILFSHINSIKHVGKVAIYHGDKTLYHGMNLLLLRPNEAILRPSYLYRVLSSQRGRANARREAKPAINQVSLAQKQVLSLNIALPPLPEQQRIVEVLDAHDAHIRAEEATVDKLRQVKRGLMDDLLTGRVRV